MSTTITIPFSIGEEVWYMYDNKLMQGIIKAYRLHSGLDGNEYAVHAHYVHTIHNSSTLRYGYKKESELFETKEELIKSLL